MSRRGNRGPSTQEQTPLEQDRGRRLTRLSTNAVETPTSTGEKRKAPGGRIQKRGNETKSMFIFLLLFSKRLARVNFYVGMIYVRFLRIQQRSDCFRS